MNLNDVWLAIDEAKRTISNGHSAVRMASKLVAGNLQASNVDHARLVELKRELARYNTRTREWQK